MVRHNRRLDKKLAYLVVQILALTMVVPLGGVAQAAPYSGDIEVSPEYQVRTVNDVTNMTATLTDGPHDEGVTIHFEQESGPGNTDGNTPSSPDKACTVVVGQTTCQVSAQSSSTGTMSWRAWVDTDNIPSTANSDPDEGHIADTAECEEAVSQGDGGADGTGNVCGPEDATPGAGCSFTDIDGQDPTAETDCTDVVEIVWVTERTPTTLDCDDSGTPQTEEEATTSVSNDASATITCFVKDQFGSGLNGVTVHAEVETNINDPDPIDGVSYSSPDYQCTTITPIPIITSAGQCDIDVDQVEQETGLTHICFWVGDVTEPAGAARCGGNEPTLENANADGSDSPNDLADSNDVYFRNPEALVLDCSPETDSNPAGTNHRVKCEAQDPGTDLTVSGTDVFLEIIGAADPDSSNSTPIEDDACTTGADGSCFFDHTSESEGSTTYHAWIDDGDSSTAETRTDGTDEDVDRTEGQNEVQTPGEKAEPDGNDVVTKTWVAPPTAIAISPEADAAEVGECNPYTISLTDESGNPAPDLIIDVEQRHESADDEIPGNEPDVGFCIPASGPNPSDVEESQGDLQPAADPNDQNADEEDPDNLGTAGGEAAQRTNANGQVTIGIEIAAAQGADGGGIVALTVFFDTNGNDDPNTGEPQAGATKQWTTPAPPGGHSIDCEPETATTMTGENHTVTCTVTDDGQQPMEGQDVTFTEEGPGAFTGPSQTTTDALGQVSATANSDEGGLQTITGTLTNSLQNEPDTDQCEEPGGTCADSVTNMWEAPEPQCNDGVDNDGDGDVDLADRGCDSPSDDDESDEPTVCPGFENDSRNQIVGTAGADDLNGTSGPDIICGLGGDDSITGGGGNDLILGGGGNDDLRGGGGNDDLRGGGGKDTMRGNAGDDELRGGGQNDVMLGNSGEDFLVGGKGEDVIRGGKDKDEIRGGAGDDIAAGGRGDDLVQGAKGKDTLRGKQGDDIIRGGADNDLLRGGTGNDKLNGGGGKDTCAGGPGNDQNFDCEK